MRILGERLGVGVANAINVFDPEHVVIGGGVSRAGELLLEPAEESAARFVLPGVGTRTRIGLARYGPQAGVRGAALLAGPGARTGRHSPCKPRHERELTHGHPAGQRAPRALTAPARASGSTRSSAASSPPASCGGWSRRTRCAASPPTRRSSTRRSSAPTTTTSRSPSSPRRQGHRAIYQALAIKDIQDACDVLRAVYDETGGADGFVSLRGRPRPGVRHRATMAQAREYWDRVDRPNLHDQDPRHRGGPARDRGDDLRGAQHQRHAALRRRAVRAGRRGLHPRPRAPPGGGQVASTSTPSRRSSSRASTPRSTSAWRATGHDELLGKAGIANARAAYQRYKEIFEGERFAALREAGARVQRPLWASTGVKNPKYRDAMYVDGLVAPDTVNTMPMATLLAAGDHAEIDGATADEDPTADLQALADAGIDLDDVTDKLLRDGVDKFVEPMEKLLDGHRHQARGDRHPAPAVDRGLAARRGRAARRRARPRPRRRTSPGASGARTTRSGARRASPRSPTAWAG